MTAEELARELEVSVRTVYRDLEALSAAGVPVWAERGPGGGLQLVDGYRTRLTGLSTDEAEALFLSGLPGPAAQLGLGTVLAAAQLKVLAALPPELRGRAARVRERFQLDAPGWFRAQDQLPCLATVAQAVWEDRRLRVRYRRPEEVVSRLLDPLGLVLKAGIWYLVARREGELRTYRVSRVAEAELTDERLERPPDFDLGRYWEASTTAFEEGLAQLDVTLRVAVEALDDLAYAVGAATLRTALAAEPAPDEAGWLTLQVRLRTIEESHDDLLRLGARVEVLEPLELRGRLAATTAAMAQRYREVA